MEEVKITKAMLMEKGSKVLGCGTTTDEKINYYGWGDKFKSLKFVVCKGYIDDWCIYLESMDAEMTLDQIKNIGNKIHNKETIKYLTNCSDDLLKRYRF